MTNTNVKLIFSNGIRTFDSIAVGGVEATVATVKVRGNKLVLRSTLVSKAGGDDGRRLDIDKRPSVTIVELLETRASSLYEFLEDAGDQCGLLRFDIDGETIWEKEADDDHSRA